MQHKAVLTKANTLVDEGIAPFVEAFNDIMPITPYGRTRALERRTP